MNLRTALWTTASAFWAAMAVLDPTRIWRAIDIVLLLVAVLSALQNFAD